MNAWIKRNQLVVFFVLACVISWAIAAPMIAVAQGWTTAPVPFSLHYLTAYGPMLAAIIVMGLADGRAGLAELWARMTKWRIGLPWLLASIFLPFALFALSAVISVALGNPWPDLGALSRINYLPDLGIGAWFLWLFNSGIGEETGWRGYALPRLQQTRSALVSTLILGLLWSCWHVPYFFYLETYRQLGLASFPAFATSILAGAVIFTWLYNSTGGSGLAAVLFHASLNFLTSSPQASTTAMIFSILVMVAGGLLALLCERRRLTLPWLPAVPESL